MVTQPDMFHKPYEPHFNGSDYVAKRDWTRLTTQLGKVYAHMSDGRWHTLPEVSRCTGAPEASVSAQLRHLRKERFGGHTIEKKYTENGFYHYRLKPNG
jgi:hypothetical protein